MKFPLLKNWFIIQLNELCAVGQLFGDRRTPAGWEIITSKILGIHQDWLITENNFYKLGQMDRVWATTDGAKILHSLKTKGD